RRVEVDATLADLTVLESEDLADLQVELLLGRRNGALGARQRPGVRASADELDDRPLVAGNHVRDLDLAVRHRGGPVVEELTIALVTGEAGVEGDVDPLHVAGDKRDALVHVAAIE